jgi:putative transposase
LLREVLKQEMTDAIGAEKGERTPGRLGYPSGYYRRALATRVGKLELQIPLATLPTFQKLPIVEAMIS